MEHHPLQGPLKAQKKAASKETAFSCKYEKLLLTLSS